MQYLIRKPQLELEWLEDGIIMGVLHLLPMKKVFKHEGDKSIPIYAKQG